MDISKAVEFQTNIAKDDQHGYDQANRKGPDYDCSALCAASLIYAGFNISPDSYTGNLRSQLVKAGFVDVSKDTDRLAGDIFLTPNKHVIMMINPTQCVTASGNEFGSARGGKTGDQTGREIYIRNFYTPSYGWKYHMRYPAKKTVHQIALEVIAGKWLTGSKRREALTNAGYSYSEVQTEVNRILYGKDLTADVKIHSVALEVIAGKWGNGSDRKKKLDAAGYDYTAVQKEVNNILKGE